MVTKVNATAAPAAPEPNPLDHLIEAADGAEAAAAVQAAAAVAKPPDDGLADDLADLLKSARDMGQGFVWWMTESRFLELWSDARLKAGAEPLAEICRRHGITFAGLMTKAGPYIALIAAFGPPTVATLQAYRNAKAAAEAQPAPAAAAAPAEGAPHGGH